MSILAESRASDSPCVEAVMRGVTTADDTLTRPAEVCWHLVFSYRRGKMLPIAVGPWTSSGQVQVEAGVEILWIRFRPGVYMPHLPARQLRDKELSLPSTSDTRFWLNSTAWQYPTYENADTFVSRLVHEQVLVVDPLVSAVLRDEPQNVPPRTLRHRFLRATGQTQGHIRQAERAQRAAALLQNGMSILDAMYEAGYYDQSHLTRSLRHFIGYTPSQLTAPSG